jgi:hypothetical protein
MQVSRVGDERRGHLQPDVRKVEGLSKKDRPEAEVELQTRQEEMER